MKSLSLISIRVTFALSVVFLMTSFSFAQVPGYQQPSDTSKPADTKTPALSEAEANAVKEINSASDAAAKLAAADAFIKKHPKSTARAEVARYVAGHIAQVADATQKLTLAESFQKSFTADGELEMIQPVILDAYLGAKRTDDAFKFGASILAKQPEDANVLTQLAIAGTEQAKQRNPKYVTQSLQYGLKAIELIEANKKQPNLDEQFWSTIKALLPHLYQDVGILSMASGNMAEAKARFEKANALDPTDPFNYVMLGSIADDEYQKAAEKYKATPEGPAKAEALKQATTLMDKVIDLYVRGVATSEGKSEYKQLHDQILEDVTLYYKYRNNGSTEGLRQLIDKHKAPPKP